MTIYTLKKLFKNFYHFTVWLENHCFLFNYDTLISILDTNNFDEV